MKIFILFFFVIFMTETNAKTLIIGDSIFALTRDVPNNLEAAGLEFEIRAQVGAKIEQIAKQYMMYKEKYGVPSIVIMDGGGNNILRGMLLECVRGEPKCFVEVERVAKFSNDFRDQLLEDGVEKIILVGIHYFHGWREPLNKIVDYAMDRIECDDSCAVVDIREPFKEDGLLLFDGIHPNAKGSKIISDLILLELQE